MFTCRRDFHIRFYCQVDTQVPLSFFLALIHFAETSKLSYKALFFQNLQHYNLIDTCFQTWKPKRIINIWKTHEINKKAMKRANTSLKWSPLHLQYCHIVNIVRHVKLRITLASRKKITYRFTFPKLRPQAPLTWWRENTRINRIKYLHCLFHSYFPIQCCVLLWNVKINEISCALLNIPAP